MLAKSLSSFLPNRSPPPPAEIALFSDNATIILGFMGNDSSHAPHPPFPVHPVPCASSMKRRVLGEDARIAFANMGSSMVPCMECSPSEQYQILLAVPSHRRTSSSVRPRSPWGTLTFLTPRANAMSVW